MMKVHRKDQRLVLGLLLASAVKFAPQQKDDEKEKIRTNIFLKHIPWEREE